MSVRARYISIHIRRAALCRGSAEEKIHAEHPLYHTDTLQFEEQDPRIRSRRMLGAAMAYIIMAYIGHIQVLAI